MGIVFLCQGNEVASSSCCIRSYTCFLQPNLISCRYPEFSPSLGWSDDWSLGLRFSVPYLFLQIWHSLYVFVPGSASLSSPFCNIFIYYCFGLYSHVFIVPVDVLDTARNSLSFIDLFSYFACPVLWWWQSCSMVIKWHNLFYGIIFDHEFASYGFFPDRDFWFWEMRIRAEVIGGHYPILEWYHLNCDP